MKKILLVLALMMGAICVMGQEQYKSGVNKKYTAVNSAEYFIDFWKQIFKNEFTSAHQDYLIQKYPNGCPKQEIILYGDYGEEGEVETIPADDVITDMVSTHYNYFQANQYPTPKYVGEIFARIYKKDYYKHISLYDLFITNQLCLDLINRGDFDRFMQNLDKSYYSYIDINLLTHAITKQDEAICSVLNACIYISMGNGGLEPLLVIFDGYYEFTNAAKQESLETQDACKSHDKMFTTPDLQFAEVRGKVRSVQYDSQSSMPAVGIEGKCFYFTKDGKIDVSKTFLDGYHIERNAKLQITTIALDEEDLPNPDELWKACGTYCIYNNNGLLIEEESAGWEWMSSSSYKYNDDNELIQKEIEWTSEDYFGFDVYIYSDYKYDNYGNWISRKVEYMGASGSEGDDLETTNETYTEARGICYYD